MYRCTFCGVEKAADAFGISRGKRKAQCRECKNAESRARYLENPEASHVRAHAWLKRDRQLNPEKYRNKYQQKAERFRETNRRWYARNRNEQRQRGLRRYYATLRPNWLTAIQRAQVEEFYDIAIALGVQTGVPHHVDHIHPLEGENLCGLHVPWNLQVLPYAENIQKGKKLLEHLGDAHGRR